MKIIAAIAFAAALSGAGAAFAQASADQPAGLKPWNVRPNGIKQMPLAGKGGTDLTTFRMFYPADFQTDRQPHVHFGTEHGYVISGAMWLGFGSCLEPEKAVRYGPGSFFEIPAGQPHFEWFEGPLEIQVSSVGPMNAAPAPGGCKPSK
jgi:quercetin dioxygenase-like cupin family protein